MGACFSSAPAHLIDQVDGDEEAYHDRFLEDQVLGEGEFGQVKMVHDVQKKSDEPFACKVLRKGAVFKDNTLYSAIKPEVLKGEIEMLRRLRGEHYCMKITAVFETPRAIFMVTEFCGGGEMMEYVSKREEDLRTEDVSRISFQLLDALAHCAKHNVIHRDIKPENVMFKDPTPQAELRLIDFGSGTMQPPAAGSEFHTTFAGSAFYTSPEMFQKTYTEKTDVWSAGVALYVLVCGYPASQLQKAFNLLQKKDRDLKELPGMPDDMPESYYTLLDKLLTYRHKQRPSAAEMRDSEFCQFHRENAEFSLDSIANNAKLEVLDGSRKNRTQSMSLKGSVGRHSIFLNFQKFERSLTALLAAMMTRKELDQLLIILKSRMATRDEEEHKEAVVDTDLTRLSVIRVNELKEIISKDMRNPELIATMSKLPDNELYGNFAYHVTLLRDFSVHAPDTGADESRGGRRRQRSNSLTGRAKMMTSSNSSVRSNRSLGGSRKRNSAVVLSKVPAPLPRELSRSFSR